MTFCNFSKAEADMSSLPNHPFFLNFLKSAIPDITDRDISPLSHNNGAAPRDLVQMFKITSDITIEADLLEKNDLSESRLNILPQRGGADELSDLYHFKRFFVKKGEVIYYETPTNDRFLLVVEF